MSDPERSDRHDDYSRESKPVIKMGVSVWLAGWLAVWLSVCLSRLAIDISLCCNWWWFKVEMYQYISMHSLACFQFTSPCISMITPLTYHFDPSMIWSKFAEPLCPLGAHRHKGDLLLQSWWICGSLTLRRHSEAETRKRQACFALLVLSRFTLYERGYCPLPIQPGFGDGVLDIDGCDSHHWLFAYCSWRWRSNLHARLMIWCLTLYRLDLVLVG